MKLLDKAKEHDRWIYGRGCPSGIIDDPLKIYELIKDKNERTLEKAKEVCAEKCNNLLNCYYAVLHYDEAKPEKADCSLIDKDCGDWINKEHLLNRYFYKKGTIKNYFKESEF